MSIAPSPHSRRWLNICGLMLGPVLTFIAVTAMWRTDTTLYIWLVFPILILALLVCFFNLFFTSRVPSALALVVGLVAGVFFFSETNRRAKGNLKPSEYPLLLDRARIGTAHLPRTLPANASDVQITAIGPFTISGLMSAPDFVVISVCYFLLPADAKQLRTVAANAAIAQDGTPAPLTQTEAGDSFVRNRARNPADFRSYLLAIPSGRNSVAGVSINTTTGEVIYWVKY